MPWAWGKLATDTKAADLVAVLNQRMAALEHEVRALDRRSNGVGTFPDGAQQPSVAGYERWIVRNSAPTNLSALREGRVGQRVTLVFLTGGTTLVHSATLRLIGGADVTPAVNTAVSLVTADGSTWIEEGR